MVGLHKIAKQLTEAVLLHQDVTKAAASEGDPGLRVLLSDHIAIGYTGITSSSRHLCLVDAEAGKVTLTTYGYMD